MADDKHLFCDDLAACVDLVAHLRERAGRYAGDVEHGEVEAELLRVVAARLKSAEAKIARVEVLPRKWRDGIDGATEPRRDCAVDLEAALYGEDEMWPLLSNITKDPRG